MSWNLSDFLDRFVLPLLGGGQLMVGAPVRPSEVRAMGEELMRAPVLDLEYLRLRQARSVVSEPLLEEASVDELGLWAALYNMLLLDHPERPRVWTRRITWRRLEAASRTFLTLGQAGSFAEALARHVAVGPFLELVRRDIVILTLEGEERYIGQPVPRRRLRYGRRDELVTWLDDGHNHEVAQLVPDVLWVSPITCMLRPALAPAGWSPLIAAPFLAERAFARAVTYAWAGCADWIEAGGAIMEGMMASIAPAPASVPLNEGDRATGEQLALAAGPSPLALAGSSFNAGPVEIGAITAALIHLHFVKVLELGARLGVATATRKRAMRLFLGLPLIARELEDFLGAPMVPPERSTGFDGQVARRWTEYSDHLADVLPRDVVENLRETLVPRILKEPTP